MTEAPETKIDYRDTVFLPKTDFPMKAGLPAKEPIILAKWQEARLYEKLRAGRKGREKFILHDGPPYANGDMHIGHALNHILKDMVCRTQNLRGLDAPYVPGWDCHGLPIEWKVEEAYRKKKLNKDEVPAQEFRAECRAYAQHWVDTQREQLKRLGINGDWDHPYLTMDFAAEATIVAELMKFAESGQLYRGAKPVMWSPVEKTALAEAEVEYEDITSTQIDVAFEIVESPIPELVGAHAVVWTTTPWTIPVNQAIAYGPDVKYVLTSYQGRKILIADDLWNAFFERVGEIPTQAELREEEEAREWRELQGIAEPVVKPSEELVALASINLSDVPTPSTFKGSDLAGTIARHPMAKLFEVPLPEGRGDSASAERGRVSDTRGSEHPRPLAGASRLPLEGEGVDRSSPLAEFFLRPRPFLPGDFVTTEQGTGLVHMAPDHGEDDFDLCKANGIEPVFAVEGDGKYRADWAWLGGQGSVINPKFNAPDGPICEDLRAAGALLAASADYKHSYPHSWRSKAKVIFRATPQWFIPVDAPLSPLPEGRGDSSAGERGRVSELRGSEHPHPTLPLKGEGLDRTLRSTALAEIERVKFIPEKGRNRIGSMVEGRPDWVISRQRAWGVPITLFVDRKTGQYLNDPAVNARVVAAIRDKGVDGWDAASAAHFLGEERDPADYEMVTDILDVWFDSGCTHAFVLESGRWPDLKWPADLYLEGSDQHRGWFQSSLLQSCGTRGRAPYDAVLTHGFTMASDGKKMSKSLGNTIDPLKVMEQYGADIIRLWALSVDFTEDHRIGDEILKGVADQYRKLRNTFRYLLGALDGFTEAERIAVAEMPELERYVLHLLADLDAKLKQAVIDYDFNSYTRLLGDFCNNDLSAFYFDIRKDSLYCDAPSSTKRCSCRTVLDILFHALIRYAAPVLVFTSEEVWGTRYPDAESVHVLEWPEVLGRNELPTVDELAWTRVTILRSEVSQAIEPLRREKTIRSSLEAEIELSQDDALLANPTGEVDLAEVFITGTVRVGNTLDVTKTTHHKCGRCWRHLPEVTEDGALCGRCAEVVNG